MIEISELVSAEQLQNFAGEWDELLERASSPTIFQTWEWISTWWRHFGAGEELWILTARENGALVGIAPLCIARFPYKTFRAAQLIGENGGGISIYLDAIIAPGHERACRDAFYAHLLAHKDRWALAELIHLRDASPMVGSDALAAAFTSTQEVEDTCLYTPLPPTWAEYAASLDAKFRQNLNRHRRLLERELHAEIELVRGDDIPEAIDELINLHKLRWSEASLFGASESERAFHRDVAGLFARRGWLRLFRVRHAGRTIGAVEGFVFRGRGYAYLQGFDPEHARFGLGVVLRAHSIEDAIAAGATEFDWMRGQSSHKHRWQVVERPVFRVVINKHTLSSRLAGVISRGGFHVFQEMLRLGWADRRQTGDLKTWRNSFPLMFGYSFLRVSSRAMFGKNDRSSSR